MPQELVGELVPTSLPMALARAHWRSQPGCSLELRVPHGDAGWRADALADVVVGAGFAATAMHTERAELVARLTRLPSLPDTVGPGMRLLVCGLNPSEYAAARGIAYARPGNRFWPAAVQAGLVTRSHDPAHALAIDGVGMTDLVKRATPRADLLTEDEYRAGAGRVRRLVEWLRPGAVCFVGLQGWRAAVDQAAVPGAQPDGFAGRPAYLMPSTSGLNAHCRLEDFVRHLRQAAALAP